MGGLEPLDRLLASLCRCCQSLPDRRSGTNTRYEMADFGLAAFSVFFMQSPSFLAYQRHLATGQGRSNCETPFGMTKIPGDSQVRAKLDPIEPSRFDPMFDTVIEERQRSGGIDQFRRLNGHVLIALDGTQYHSSNKVSCPQCSTRQHGNGKTEYHHDMLAATLVAPGHNRVVPLIPEFILPQDGHEKQDCESRAARPPPSQGQAVGWQRTVPVTPHSTRCFWVMICSPVSQSARRCWPRTDTFCSSVNTRRIQRSRHIGWASGSMN